MKNLNVEGEFSTWVEMLRVNITGKIRVFTFFLKKSVFTFFPCKSAFLLLNLQSGGKYCYTNTMRNLLNTSSAKVNKTQETLRFCTPSFSLFERGYNFRNREKGFFRMRISDNTFSNLLPENLNNRSEKKGDKMKNTIENQRIKPRGWSVERVNSRVSIIEQTMSTLIEMMSEIDESGVARITSKLIWIAFCMLNEAAKHEIWIWGTGEFIVKLLAGIN